jgi:hypothetical protein
MGKGGRCLLLLLPLVVVVVLLLLVLGGARVGWRRRRLAAADGVGSWIAGCAKVRPAAAAAGCGSELWCELARITWLLPAPAAAVISNPAAHRHSAR